MMKIISRCACIISAIGAVNWGLVAFMQFNLVGYISSFFGMMPMIDNLLYGIIALSGAFVLVDIFTAGCSSCD